MSDIVGNLFATRIRWTHLGLLSVTEDLSDEQLAQQPGPLAPPIGWHLWHIARWADRLWASFPNRSETAAAGRAPDIADERWQLEGLASAWGLEPEKLGVLQTGMGMAVEDAVAVARAGRERLFGYARRMFEESYQAIADMDVAQLQEPRQSIAAFQTVEHRPEPAPGKATTVVSDLGFHLAHANRHLGMIEGLRGAMFAIHGTASV